MSWRNVLKPNDINVHKKALIVDRHKHCAIIWYGDMKDTPDLLPPAARTTEIKFCMHCYISMFSTDTFLLLQPSKILLSEIQKFHLLWHWWRWMSEMMIDHKVLFPELRTHRTIWLTIKPPNHIATNQTGCWRLLFWNDFQYLSINEFNRVKLVIPEDVFRGYYLVDDCSKRYEEDIDLFSHLFLKGEPMLMHGIYVSETV